MSRAEELWERLVRAALRRERFGMGSVGHAAGGIAGYVPSSLNNRDIDTILRVADEIQDEEPNVARICMFISFPLVCNIAMYESFVILSTNPSFLLIFIAYLCC
ncbi:hypothetical protein ERO13_D08G023033v2 [Gossypium hirsutum]|nr:hypothetical protein ERO13_D08G023033v2 [Gossypium hirsutum]